MTRLSARPKTLAFLLLFLTSIPIVMAAVTLYQIPAGQLPVDSVKFTVVPVALFAHALGGMLFGILGPIQFAGVLKQRFGRAHRITGRVFVAVGMLLALSSLRLLWQFPDTFTWVLALARLAAGVGLAAALVIALMAISRRNLPRHKAWMIRAYAIGMGQSTVSFLMLPIYLITGEPLKGYLSDLVVVGFWAINIAIGEWVIRRPFAPAGAAVRA